MATRHSYAIYLVANVVISSTSAYALNEWDDDDEAISMMTAASRMIFIIMHQSYHSKDIVMTTGAVYFI